MHDAATGETAALYELEHRDVTGMRFNAQAPASVLIGYRLRGLQQLAAKALPSVALRNRNTM